MSNPAERPATAAADRLSATPLRARRTGNRPHHQSNATPFPPAAGTGNHIHRVLSRDRLAEPETQLSEPSDHGGRSDRSYLAGHQSAAYAALACHGPGGAAAPSVDVCEFDPLRDEGIEYARRLVQAGVDAELHLYPGTFHGSSMMAGAAVAPRMSRRVGQAFRRLLRKGGS
jgi:alpha/beta hydrolase fold